MSTFRFRQKAEEGMKKSEVLGLMLLLLMLLFTVAVVEIRLPYMVEEAHHAMESAKVYRDKEINDRRKTEEHMRLIGCVTLDCAINKTVKK